MLQQILQTVTPKEAAPASEPAKSQDKTTKSLFAKLMGVLNMDIKAQKTAPETPENKLQAIATAENKTNQVAEKELNRLTFHKLTNSNPEKELSSLDREGEEKGEDISMPPVAIPVTGIVKTRTTVALGKAVNGQRNNDTGASGKLITKTAKIRIQTGKTPSENKLNLIKQESQTGLGKGDALPPDSKGVSKPVVIEATPKSDIQSSDTSSSTLARVTTKQAKVTRPGAISPSSTSVMPKPESAVKTPTHTSTRTEAAIEQKQIITSAKHQTNEDSHIRPAISDHPSPVAPQTAHKKPNITSGSYQMMASAENLNIGKNPRSIYTSSHKSHIPSPEVKKAVVLQQIAPTPIFGESELSGGNSGLNFSGRFADPGNSLIFNTSGLEPASTAVAQTNSRASISAPGSGPWNVAAAMQEIGHAAAEGRFRLKLALEPAHLGKIQVFLESDANKQIQVHLLIEQASSRQALEQQLPSLRQALANQGLSLGNFSMSSQQDSGRQHLFQEHNTPTTHSASVLIQTAAGTEQKSGVSNGHISIHI